MLLNLSEAASRYGEIVNGLWPDEGKWCSFLDIPPAITGWMNSMTKAPVTRIYCNNDMHAPLFLALTNVVSRNLVAQLRSFDGCYQIRCVRGRDALSWHSYGLAIDMDAADNQMGTTGDLTPGVVACFTDAGFIWGGDFKSRTDPMHFQWGVG